MMTNTGPVEGPVIKPFRELGKRSWFGNAGCIWRTPSVDARSVTKSAPAGASSRQKPPRIAGHGYCQRLPIAKPVTIDAGKQFRKA